MAQGLVPFLARPGSLVLASLLTDRPHVRGLPLVLLRAAIAALDSQVTCDGT